MSATSELRGPSITWVRATLLSLLLLSSLGLALDVGGAAWAQLPIPGAGGDESADASPEEATAEEAPDERPSGVPEPFDPLARDSPRSAMRGFLEAARATEYGKAAEYLDLSRIPRAQRDTLGAELAWKLKVVLDRKLWVEMERLSNEWEGDVDDGYKRSRDRVGVIETEEGDVEIAVARVPGTIDGQRRPLWKIDAHTVARIEELYERFGYGLIGPLVAHMPTWAKEPFLLDVSLWQWIGVALAFVVGFLLATLITAFLRRLLPRLIVRKDEMLRLKLSEGIRGPLRLIIFAALSGILISFLALPIPGQRAVQLVLSGLFFLGITWLVFRLFDHIARLADSKAQNTEGGKRLRGLIALAGSIAKGAFLGFAIIVVLQNAGFNVSSVLAGLGIGGLALTFGAQKTIENLFGGVSVIADQPVSVGDFCRFAGTLGTIERIGLRSTWIRTLDRTLLSVPNSIFSTTEVENFAPRDKIRLYAIINLRYETTPDQLRWVLSQIRSLLVAHPTVDPDPARVRFMGFGAHSLDLEIFAYIATNDWNAYLAIREDIYLRIMDIVAEAGAAFAFPSQTLYLGRDEQPDAERISAAETRVREWRERGALPFPDYAPEELERFRGSVEYPPQGSALKQAGEK